MTLRPDKTIQKTLISSTSRLVGEYEKTGFLLAHAWPDFADNAGMVRIFRGPASRSAYIFAFETVPEESKPGIVVPNYSRAGEVICSYLSVLFGKRFDSHGLLEGSGTFHIPELSHFSKLCNPHLPHNSHDVRKDFRIPLNLGECERIESLWLDGTINEQFRRTFDGASKFYLQALQTAESDSEVAYLHLITAGEILSNFYSYKKEDLLDDQIKEMLSKIETQLQDGSKIVASIAARLRQIKKRFVRTIVSLIDETFFASSESVTPFTSFKAESFEASISAAYDLRSRYVHTGVPFGRWISFDGSGGHEVQFGNPIVEDKELADILAHAPTYIGLERVIRYCLIRFAKQHNVYHD